MRSSFLVFLLLSFVSTSSAQSGFWSPVVPPRAQYQIDCSLDSKTGQLSGRETVSFRNTTSRPIERLALDWKISEKQSATVSANGKRALLVVQASQKEAEGPLLVQLPGPLEPNQQLLLKVEFHNSYGSEFSEGAGNLLQAWYPKLWWGFGTLDDYVVKISVPESWKVVTSGKWDAHSGAWIGKGARDFVMGIYDRRKYAVETAQAGDVQVSVVHTEAGTKCAALLLQTAVDAIGFYRQRFGFYPHQSLTMVPGADSPTGGYPAGTAMVVIHGEEQMDKKPEAHFRWITAHEIGHMYWSQYVLAEGEYDLNWFMIGMGIFADREYRRAREIAPPVGNLSSNYVGGMKDGFDTTMDLTDEQEELIDWDFNNVVEHGKSSAMLDALESTIGAQTFDRAYRRTLREFHGKRMGWRDFERVCDEESGEDLDWFFESWARSNEYSFYRVGHRESARSDSGWHSEVEVLSEGTRLQRVPVVAIFEDGSQQRQMTDRLARVSVLSFESKSRLQEAKLDPENTLWMLDAEPPLSAADLQRKIVRMNLTGTGEDALALLPRARELQLSASLPWRRLGLMLYDGKHYTESLECFKKAYQTTTDRDYQFLALVWQGQLLDLMGRRDAAIEVYKAAETTGSQEAFRHDQYKLRIDQAWVQQRLQTPFKRD